MASSTLALFRALVPDLCAEPDSRVELFIEIAAQRLDASVWGAVYGQAVVYVAAHLLLRSPTGGSGGVNVDGGGPIKSKKAGDLAVTYGASVGGGGSTSNTDADYQETHYGRQFLVLRDTRAAGAPDFLGV